MSADNDKPYVLRVAELIYSKIDKIKKENSEMSNIQAFEVFMTTKDYIGGEEFIQIGELKTTDIPLNKIVCSICNSNVKSIFDRSYTEDELQKLKEKTAFWYEKPNKLQPCNI